ncbi:Uncharacterised protein [Mycobacteroides abscessus subsp. abscessus]|nr:Uncharacterised protein [Mycobacteroides abscessus subsp. abscessus]
MARPGSITNRGSGRPASADSVRTMTPSLAAKSSMGGGSSDGT